MKKHNDLMSKLRTKDSGTYELTDDSSELEEFLPKEAFMNSTRGNLHQKNNEKSFEKGEFYQEEEEDRYFREKQRAASQGRPSNTKEKD